MKGSLLYKVQRSISNPRSLLTVLLMILLGSCGPKRADDEAIERFKQWFRDFYLAVENHADLDPYVGDYEIQWSKLDASPNYNPYHDPVYNPKAHMRSVGGEEEFLRAMEWFNANFGLPEAITIYEATYKKWAYKYYWFELEVRRQFANTKEAYFFWKSDVDGEFKTRLIVFLEARLHNEDKEPVPLGELLLD